MLGQRRESWAFLLVVIVSKLIGELVSSSPTLFHERWVVQRLLFDHWPALVGTLL